MKLLSSVLMIAVTFAACSSSKSDADKSSADRSNQIPLNPPTTQQYDQSKVYVDSVNMVDQGLLISGNLPDGCSKLHKASHTMRNDSLNITLTAWKPSDKMCTQSLVPFSFLYQDLSSQALSNRTSLSINGESFNIDR
jgi:hypothetical protein